MKKINLILFFYLLFSILFLSACKKEKCEKEFICKNISGVDKNGFVKGVYYDNINVQTFAINPNNFQEIVAFGVNNASTNETGLSLINYISNTKREILDIVGVVPVILFTNSNWIVFELSGSRSVYKIRPDGSALHKISHIQAHSPIISYDNLIVFSGYVTSGPQKRFYYDLELDEIVDSITGYFDFRNELRYPLIVQYSSGITGISIQNGSDELETLIEPSFLPSNQVNSFIWIGEFEYLVSSGHQIFKGDIREKNKLVLIHENECNFVYYNLYHYDTLNDLIYLRKTERSDHPYGFSLNFLVCSMKSDGTDIQFYEIPQF